MRQVQVLGCARAGQRQEDPCHRTRRPTGAGAEGEEGLCTAAFEGPERETLGALLAAADPCVGRVGCSDPAIFAASGGGAYVACFWGVKDGHLWPLKQGMVRPLCRPHIRFYRCCALLAHTPL